MADPSVWGYSRITCEMEFEVFTANLCEMKNLQNLLEKNVKTETPDQEELEVDYEQFISETSPDSSEPSRKRKRKSELRTQLDQAVRGGKLDLVLAGLAIHNAYETRQSGIPQDIGSFISRNSMIVPFPQVPDTLQTDSITSMNSMIHGYGLAAQLALVAANKSSRVTRIITPTKDNFNFVSDSPSSVKSEFSFPVTPPFSGIPIEIEVIRMLDATVPAHIRLQNYLFQLLGKACAPQSDIQRFWIIPGEKHHRYGNPKIFPLELYDNLQQLFLEFFQLDCNDFDEPDYCDEFSSMEILTGYHSYESKKQRFEEMAAARKVFKSSIFLLELKAALKELRHGTLVIPEGSTVGYFAKRQRHLPKKLLNGDKTDEKVKELTTRVKAEQFPEYIDER